MKKQNYDEYFKLIEKLKCVSIREESGKEFLIKNINKEHKNGYRIQFFVEAG